MLHMLQMVIAVLSVLLFPFTEMGKCISSLLFLYHQKDGTPFVLYSPTTNGGVYYVKETENADLKSGYADIVNN